MPVHGVRETSGVASLRRGCRRRRGLPPTLCWLVEWMHGTNGCDGRCAAEGEGTGGAYGEGERRRGEGERRWWSGEAVVCAGSVGFICGVAAKALGIRSARVEVVEDEAVGGCPRADATRCLGFAVMLGSRVRPNRGLICAVPDTPRSCLASVCVSLPPLGLARPCCGAHCASPRVHPAAEHCASSWYTHGCCMYLWGRGGHCPAAAHCLLACVDPRRWRNGTANALNNPLPLAAPSSDHTHAASPWASSRACWRRWG